MLFKLTLRYQYLIFIVFSQITLAQNSQSYALTEILNHLENKKNITFSYELEFIKGVTLRLENIGALKQVTIDQIKKKIRSQTLLGIKKKKDIYIIYPHNKAVKITGKVVDLFTGKPIEGVFVTDSFRSVYTDKQGRFVINSKALHQLEFYAPAYKTFQISVQEAFSFKKFVATLTAYSEHLDEIVLVKDYPVYGVDKNRNGSLSLSPKKLKLVPGLIEPDVLQAIQLLPGVNSATESVSELSIRGGTSDQNLILWNGIRIYGKGHFLDKISQFNPYLTDQVTLYRNGTSAKYGGRTAGVIDMKTSDNLTTTVSGSAGLNTTHGDLNIRIPLGDKLSLTLGSRYSINDFLINKKNVIISENTLKNNIGSFISLSSGLSDELENAVNFYDIAASASWKITDQNKLQLNYIHIDNTIKSSFKKGISVFEGVNTNSLQNYGTSLIYKNKTTQKLDSEFGGQFNLYDTNKSNSEVLFTNDEDIINRSIIKKFRLNDIRGWYNGLLGFSNTSSLWFGYEFSYQETSRIDNERFEGDLTFYALDKLNTHAFFSEFNYNSSKFRLRAGIRSNYYRELDRLFIEPRLFSFVKLFRGLSLHVTAEYKTQAMRQEVQDTRLNVNSDFFDDNLWYLANTGNLLDNPLPILTSKQFGIGVTYKFNGLVVDLDSYYKKNDGLIFVEQDEIGFAPLVTTFYGYSLAKGLDFFVKKQFRNYRSWIAYSWSENYVTFPDIEQSNFGIKSNRFPSKTGYRHIFNWSHALEINRIQLGLSWNFRSGALYSVPNSVLELSTLGYDSLNDQRLPNYSSINASILYTFKTKNNIKIQIGASAQNILDRSNKLNRRFSVFNFGSYPAVFSLFNNDGEIEDIYQVDANGIPFTPDFMFRVLF